MKQILIASLLAAMMMCGPGFCWVDITSDAILKSAINQPATFILMYADPYWCPISVNQSRQNKVNIRGNVYLIQI